MKNKFLLAAVLLFTACSLFKDTEAFKKAQSFLESNLVVQDKIGKISNYGNPMGSYNLNGDFGDAQFSFSITGDKAKGDVNIKLEKSSFDWVVKSAWLKIGSDQQIDLLTMGSPLSFYNSYLSDEKWGAPKNPPRFKTGQTIFYQAQARGLKPDDKGIVYVQIDAQLTLPDGSIQTEKEAMKGPTESGNGTIDAFYDLDTAYLNLKASDKPYRFQFTLWDLTTKQTTEVANEFYLED